MSDSEKEENEYSVTEALYKKILEKENDESCIINKTNYCSPKKKYNNKVKQNILIQPNENNILNERKFNPRLPPYKLK